MHWWNYFIIFGLLTLGVFGVWHNRRRGIPAPRLHIDCAYCPGGKSRDEIERAARWIQNAPDDQERYRRWDTIDALAGMFQPAVASHIRQILGDDA